MNLWRVGKEWKGHGREKAVLWNNPETRAYAWDKRWHIRVDGLLKVPGNVGYWLCGFVEEAGTSVITKLVSYEWGRLFSEGWELRALREAASVWRVGLVVCSHVWISIYLYRESLYENTLWINFLTSMEYYYKNKAPLSMTTDALCIYYAIRKVNTQNWIDSVCLGKANQALKREKKDL